MIKYAKIINDQTGLCEVGLGTNTSFYQSIGMKQLNVQQSDIDDAWYLADKCPMKTDEQKELEEKERIAKLTMTPLDFINFLVSCGLTLEQINYYLETHLDVKMQLTYCSNVFCGVACALMPVTIGDITITEEMVISAFIKKNEV